MTINDPDTEHCGDHRVCCCPSLLENVASNSTAYRGFGRDGAVLWLHRAGDRFRVSGRDDPGIARAKNARAQQERKKFPHCAANYDRRAHVDEGVGGGTLGDIS